MNISVFTKDELMRAVDNLMDGDKATIIFYTKGGAVTRYTFDLSKSYYHESMNSGRDSAGNNYWNYYSYLKHMPPWEKRKQEIIKAIKKLPKDCV